MLKRVGGYLLPRKEPAPESAASLQANGYCVLEAVFDAASVAELATEITAVYEGLEADARNTRLSENEADDFRYEMFNRCAAAQRAVGHPRILETIEPLLGEDCHIIANTCWRNPPDRPSDQGGAFWHIDAGPHVPRAAGIPWDQRIPYPVFAIGAHLFLQDCNLASGPTGVIPRSHTSGRPPPADAGKRDDLSYDGNTPVALEARAGDVALFVSDVWHRRLPTGPGDQGRFFLQAHYARRDIAQRVRPTETVNHVADAARARVASKREALLLGLHPKGFYDG